MWGGNGWRGTSPRSAPRLAYPFAEEGRCRANRAPTHQDRGTAWSAILVKAGKGLSPSRKSELLKRHRAQIQNAGFRPLPSRVDVVDISVRTVDDPFVRITSISSRMPTRRASAGHALTHAGIVTVCNCSPPRADSACR